MERCWAPRRSPLLFRVSYGTSINLSLLPHRVFRWKLKPLINKKHFQLKVININAVDRPTEEQTNRLTHGDEGGREGNLCRDKKRVNPS